MSNWDLMMPGMGLTGIGLAGVILSYSGIAHTFADGMHALTGLTMFIGLIFLSAGILDGGVSTSNKAKATTVIVLSIAIAFGAYALTMNSSSYTVTLVGVLMAIAFPTIIITYLAAKNPTKVKPVGIIISVSSIVAIIIWVSFVMTSPDTAMVAEPPVESNDMAAKEIASTAPIFAITILENSVTEGNPDYEPDVAKIRKGDIVEWTNVDSMVHTVTSSVDFGDTFNSNMIKAGEKFTLDTSALSGEYEYMCMVHPWMIATIQVE
jgi:plastocyanin